MSAGSTGLSEEDYTSRRKYLEGQLTLAQRALGDAELASADTQNWASDEAEDEPLVAARGKVATIEGKLRGLDVAWARSQEVQNEQASAEEIRARIEAAHKVEELFGQYTENLVALEELIMELRPILAALAQLPVAMITTVQPHRRALNSDTFSAWLGTLRSTDWLKSMIDGCLYAAGFGRLGFTPKQSQTIGSDVLIDRLIKNILTPLGPLLNGEGETEDQAKVAKV